MKMNVEMDVNELYEMIQEYQANRGEDYTDPLQVEILTTHGMLLLTVNKIVSWDEAKRKVPEEFDAPVARYPVPCAWLVDPHCEEYSGRREVLLFSAE
jgi:hypothetical protein